MTWLDERKPPFGCVAPLERLDAHRPGYLSQSPMAITEVPVVADPMPPETWFAVNMGATGAGHVATHSASGALGGMMDVDQSAEPCGWE